MGENVARNQQWPVRRGGLRIGVLGCCAAFWAFLLPHTDAQDFFLTLTNTPGPVAVTSNLVYSLTVSNARGVDLNPGLITSEFPPSAEIISGTNSHGGVTNVGAGIVTFGINPFTNRAVVHIQLTLRATETGLFTNVFTVTEPRSTAAETNAVTQVVAGFADLGVTITGPPRSVFVGDTFTYHLIAENAGPDAVSDVVVSNAFPTNVTLVELNPSGAAVLTNSFIVFSPATDQTEASVTVRVNTTNLIALEASISAPDVVDDNPTNDTFTTAVNVLTPVFGQIVVTNISAQQFNPQTGYVEQQVELMNVSTAAVESVRLLVDGLTNRLMNAVATNGTTPFVENAAPIEAGERVRLLLEYFIPSRTAGINPALTAYGIPAFDLTPEAGTGVHVDLLLPPSYFTNLNAGRAMIEFAAEAGERYQVVYSGPGGVGDEQGSLPPVVAHGNRVQWLDYGPPRTLTAPTNASSRFYRVILLP